MTRNPQHRPKPKHKHHKPKEKKMSTPATPIKANTQDAFFTIRPLDDSGNVGVIDPASLTVVSSNPAAFENAVLEPPVQDPKQVYFMMRAKCVSTTVGAKATFTTTATNSAGDTISGNEVGAEVIAESPTPPDPGTPPARKPATFLGVQLTPIGKVPA
jgi:hypothetical protein